MVLRSAVCAAAAALWSHACAQETNSLALRGAPPGSVAILDYDAAYNSSEFGKRIQAEFASARQFLLGQNRYFDCLLTSEENQIAGEKPDMNNEAFNALRDEFRAKARERRQIQDEKVVRLSRWLEAENERFSGTVDRISEEMATEHGLLAVFSDDAFYFDGAIELTRLFVDKLNNDTCEISAGSSFCDGTEENYVTAAAYVGLNSADIDAESVCAWETAEYEQ